MLIWRRAADRHRPCRYCQLLGREIDRAAVRLDGAGERRDDAANVERGAVGEPPTTLTGDRLAAGAEHEGIGRRPRRRRDRGRVLSVRDGRRMTVPSAVRSAMADARRASRHADGAWMRRCRQTLNVPPSTVVPSGILSIRRRRVIAPLSFVTVIAPKVMCRWPGQDEAGDPMPSPPLMTPLSEELKVIAPPPSASMKPPALSTPWCRRTRM